MITEKIVILFANNHQAPSDWNGGCPCEGVSRPLRMGFGKPDKPLIDVWEMCDCGLTDAVESLLKQTHDEYEMVVRGF